jgi:hypothetical protein
MVEVGVYRVRRVGRQDEDKGHGPRNQPICRVDIAATSERARNRGAIYSGHYSSLSSSPSRAKYSVALSTDPGSGGAWYREYRNHMCCSMRNIMLIEPPGSNMRGARHDIVSADNSGGGWPQGKQTGKRERELRRTQARPLRWPRAKKSRRRRPFHHLCFCFVRYDHLLLLRLFPGSAS